MGKLEILTTVIFLAFVFLGFCLGFCCKFTNLVFEWYKRKMEGLQDVGKD